MLNHTIVGELDTFFGHHKNGRNNVPDIQGKKHVIPKAGFR